MVYIKCTGEIFRILTAVTQHSCDLYPIHKNQITWLLEVISLSFNSVVTGCLLLLVPYITSIDFNYFLFCASYIPTYKCTTHTMYNYIGSYHAYNVLYLKWLHLQNKEAAEWCGLSTLRSFAALQLSYLLLVSTHQSKCGIWFFLAMKQQIPLHSY